MSTDDNISKLIKESFENSHCVAPDSIWNEIDDTLNHTELSKKIKSSFENINETAPVFNFDEILSDNQKLDKKIAQSFSTLSNDEIAPQNTWDNIQNNIDINRVWNTISTKVYTPQFSWHKFSMALVLTILTTTIPSFYLTNPIQTVKPIYSNLSEPLISELPFLPQEYNNPALPFDRIITPINNNTILSTYHKDNKNGIPATKNTNKIEPKNDKINYNLNVNEIRTDLHQIPINLQDNNIEFWNELNEEKSIFNHFRIGLGTNLVGTIINDQERKNSFEKNSLTTSKISYNLSPNVIAEYQFKSNLYIGASVNFMFSSKNKIGLYENGCYHEKQTQINYTKFNIHIGFRDVLEKQLGLRGYNISIGPYLGRKNYSSTSTNSVITAYNDQYKKLDFGLNLNISKSHEISKFILEYGLTSNIGLINILKESNISVNTPKNFTSNLNGGLFVQLKYNIF